MKTQKQSRLDRLEKVMGAMTNLLKDQDQAIRWLIEQVKDKDAVEDPNQTKMDL